MLVDAAWSRLVVDQILESIARSKSRKVCRIGPLLENGLHLRAGVQEGVALIFWP
jgi:hypothetical protein